MSTRLTVAAVLLASTVVSGRAEAAAPAYTVEVNRPSVAGVEDRALLTRLVALVDGAATGSTIRVSLPALTEPQITERLLAAQNEREVTVLAVAERCATRDAAGACPAPPAALSALAIGLPSGNFTWCTEGCLTATGALNAAGFWVFDALADGRRDVVVQTSADPTAGAGRANHDLVVVNGDAPLAAGYRDYFTALVAGQPVSYTGSVAGADGRTEAFFFPRAVAEPDPLVAPINDLRCPDGVIRVVAGAWLANRTALISAIKAKRTAGCAVEVAVSDRNDALPELARGGFEVFTFRPGGCRYPAGGDCATGALGSTFVLLSGVSTSNGAAVGAVFTGPRGLTDQQLRRDDSVLLRLSDPAVYQAYDARWLGLRDAAMRILPDTWPNATRVLVNSVATGDQDAAAVAANRNGHVAVAWEDDRSGATPEDPVHSEVFVRLFQNGTSRYELKLSAGGSGNWRHIQPDVALDDAGNAVVAWATDGDGNGYFDITAVMVRPAGTIAGTVKANASSTGQQIEPAVAADPDGGGFVVTWEDIQAGTPASIRAARFASVSSKAYEVQVNGATAAGGGQHRPDVAVSGASNAAIVWDEDGDGNGVYNVGLRILTPSGGTKLAQTTANADSGGQQRHASVAANLNGDTAVAWEDDRSGSLRVYTRQFTSAGVPLTGDVPVAGDGAGAGEPVGVPGSPQVGIDDQRCAVVAWTEAGYSGPDVWARGLNRDGTATGRLPALRLNPTTGGRQEEPALGVSPWGEVSLGYTDDLDGNGSDQVLLRTGFANSVW